MRPDAHAGEPTDHRGLVHGRGGRDGAGAARRARTEAHAHGRTGRAPGDGRGPRRSPTSWPGSGESAGWLDRGRASPPRCARRTTSAYRRQFVGRVLAGNRRAGPHMTDVDDDQSRDCLAVGRPAGRARGAAARIRWARPPRFWRPQLAPLSAAPSRHPPRHARARPVGGAGGRVQPRRARRATRWACSMPPASNARRVCGVSLGGMTAMWLAAHAPERVRALVAVSTALKIGVRATWEERSARSRPPAPDRLPTAPWAAGSRPASAAPHPDVVAWCRTMLAACPTDGYVGCCAIAARSRPPRRRPAHRRADARDRRPRGSGDAVADAHEIADHIAGARLTTLDASHICAVRAAGRVHVSGRVVSRVAVTVW